MIRQQLAQLLKQSLEANTGIAAKIWIKDEKVRLYLTCKNHEIGFVDVRDDIIKIFLIMELHYQSETFNLIYNPIQNVCQKNSLNYRIELAEQYYQKRPYSKDYRSDTQKALDAIYGRGGWDDRDRLDYEG